MAVFFRFLVNLFFLWLAWTLVRSFFRAFFSVQVSSGRHRANGHGADSGKGRNVSDMAKDPVCGSYVSVVHALRGDFGGESHYFCSEKCRDEFRVKIGA